MAYAGEYVYLFRIEDHFTPTLERFQTAKSAHKTAMEEMKVSYGAVAEEQERLSTRLLRYHGIVVQASIVSFVYNLTQRRLAHAHEAVRVAQERLERATRKYGAGSEEAERAARKLELAQADLSRAYWEAGFQATITIVQLGFMALRFWEATAKSGLFSAATAADIPVQAAHTGILATKAKMLTVITFGAAAAAAAIAWFSFQTRTATNDVDRFQRSTEELRRTLGERPSYGLVKSFEDVVYAAKQVQVTIGAPIIHVEPYRQLRFQLIQLVDRLEDEIRRASA